MQLAPYLAALLLMYVYNIPLIWIIFVFWLDEFWSIFFVWIRIRLLIAYTNHSQAVTGPTRYSAFTTLCMVFIHTPFVVFIDSRIYHALVSQSEYQAVGSHPPVYGVLVNGYDFIFNPSKIDAVYLNTALEFSIFFILIEMFVWLKIMYKKIPKEELFDYHVDLIGSAMSPPMRMHFVILILFFSYFIGVKSIEYYVGILILLRLLFFLGPKKLRPDIAQMAREMKQKSTDIFN